MFQPPLGKPWLLYGLLGSSLALNLVMVLDRSSAEPSPAAVEAAPAPQVAPAPPVVTPLPTEGPEQASSLAAVDPAAATSTPAAPPVAPAGGDWNIVTGTVSHSLARTFQEQAGEDGNALGAVYARLFVWDLDLRRDLQAGDEVEVAWKRLETGEIEIGAARLRSHKFGRTFTAYRYQAPGDTFASYWQEEGTEVPYRLVESPLDEYEQITSLLKDRPNHKGMDFKTPVGTPVKAPRSGVVQRVNWNVHANGDCVEVRNADGVLAKYLHLNAVKVKVGDHVSAGQVIALSGNTGRSTAPHLHYQLNRGDKVLDPLDYHPTVRRTLDPAAMADFQQQVARMDATLGQAVALR